MHSVAKGALPVCCVIRAALGQLTTIEEDCIHWQQAGYISGFPNLAYTTGHVVRAAGGESILYFTKTSVTI